MLQEHNHNKHRAQRAARINCETNQRRLVRTREYRAALLLRDHIVEEEGRIVVI